MWGIVGDDLCWLATKAFSNRDLTKPLNRGLIKLIPKNSTRNSIRGWRPITLLNVSYKTLAKAVDLHICVVAKKVVWQEETSFL